LAFGDRDGTVEGKAFCYLTPQFQIVMPVSVPAPLRGTAKSSSESSSTAASKQPTFIKRWSVSLSAVVIVAAVTAAYANSFGGAMVFDDRPWILENESVHHLGLGDIITPQRSGLVGGRPLVSLSLAVNYAIGGTNPWGYHLVNFVTHALAALVLFGIVRRTLLLPRFEQRFAAAATPLALAVALVWALHPLTTAAVTYIIQRAESLMALFYLLTLYCTIRGATAAGGVVRRRLWYVAAIVACLCGMVTKEVMFTAPVVVLLYDAMFLAGSLEAAIKQRRGLYAGMAATWSAGVLLLWLTDFHGGTTGSAVQQFTWLTYLETQPGVILHYLQLAFWPAGLSLDYNWNAPDSIVGIAVPGVIVIALLGLTIVGLIKRSAWGFLAAAFFLILAPTSSFIPIRDAAFDHRMYLPLAAVVTLAVFGVYLAWRRLSGMDEMTAAERNKAVVTRWAPAAFLAVIALAFGWATINRNSAYASEELIWNDVIAKHPDNWRAYASLAKMADETGRTADAVKLYDQAASKNQNEPQVQLNLADALLDQGKVQEAIPHYQNAIKLEPTSAIANNNLGDALAKLGRLPEAEDHYRRALALDGALAAAASNLAGLWVTEHRFDDAMKLAADVVAKRPDFASGHANLALALLAKNQLDPAIEHFRKALELGGPNDEVEASFAVALIARGKLSEAAVYLEKGLRRNPNDAEAHFRLGSLYDKDKQTDEAIAAYRKALELKPNHVQAHLNLGAILAKQGKIPEAIDHYNAWLEARPDDAAMHVNIADLYVQRAESRTDSGAPEDFRKARVHYSTALATDSRNAAAHKGLADCFQALGQTDEAIAELRSAIEIDPKDERTHSHLALLFSKQGELKGAAEQFAEIVRLDPKNADAHYNLGMAYYAEGNSAEAAAHWRAAVAARPGQVIYLRPLAWLLATCPDEAVRNGAEAVKLAEEAVKTTPDDPAQVGTLAAAYAEAGQFPKAVSNAVEALDLALKRGNTSLADELSDKLKLYRAGKPFHEKPRGK
jgi:tetratricopeptide (TPR) repeat protein